MPITDAQIEDLVGRIRAWAASLDPAAPPPAAATKPAALALAGTNTSGWGLTFEEAFSKPGDPDWSRWDSVLPNSDHGLSGSALVGNQERQWYINHRGPLTIKPWAVGTDGLVITADRLPPDLAESVGYAQADANTKGFYRYSSGLLHTKPSFSQTYGYFEIDCSMPAGRGLWPAFWMLPQSGAWPPEIDIFEVLGNAPNDLYTTAHFKDAAGAHQKAGIMAWVDTTQRHRYGALWEPNKITLFIDGAPAGGGVIPCGIHEPMHLLINLAVGGGWPGDPDDTTKFPARMVVHGVRAWRLG